MERKQRMVAVGAAATAGLVACVGLVGLATAQDRPGGDVAFPGEVLAAASAFDTYMDRAAALNGAFRDGAGVHRSLRTGVAYEMSQFEAGMIGYGAIVAVRDRAFDEGVERAAGRFGGPRALAERLLENPDEVTRIEGAQGAAGEVAAALERRAERVTAAGRSVKQAAYDVQHQAWSKVNVSNPSGRLAEAKALSAQRFVASSADGARLMRAELDRSPGDERADGAFSPVIVRSLALAAEAVLGAGSEASNLRPLLSEPSGADCLNMAKLNLYQCLAVAGPHYEDLFCLGQHALIDTGQCVSKAASARRVMTSAWNAPARSYGDEQGRYASSRGGRDSGY
jgi:hypothetical protein